MLKNKYLTTVSVLALLAMSGCQNHVFLEKQQDYLQRVDGVTSHAGNHLPANELKMVSDPWKSRADNTHLHGNGKRIAGAVTRYENSGADDGSGDGTQAAILPTGASPIQ